MSINIIGGRSSYRQVAILSERFTAIASFRKNGLTDHKIVPHSSLSLFLYKRRWLRKIPFLQLFMFILFLVDTMSKKVRIILGSVLFGAVLTQILTNPKLRTPSSPTTLQLGIICVGIICGMLVEGYLFSQLIGPWHGAEHMTIAAYREHRSTDIEVIKRQNRVDEQCAGRLLFPFVAIITIANITAAQFNIYQPALVSLAAAELVLWIDGLIGWQRIPVSREVSRLLQMRITTRQPGNEELQTAQHALKTLVGAHQQS